ncbi:MAG: DUF2490 domain-containing protein [Candidatus Marinimicrobia bacterium]|nr:DUF2490 domain-containing protein [Candidatus Neomarinimicrobiota bacterium]
MRNRVIIILAILVIFAGNVFSVEIIWNQYALKLNLKERLNLSVSLENRYDDRLGGYFYSHYDYGFDFKVNNFLSIGPYYRQVFEIKNSNWITEYRPYLYIKGKYNFGKMSVEVRDKIVRRIKSDEKLLRNRTQLRVNFPVYIEFSLKPFIAYELFYESDVQDFNRNRVYVGIGFYPAKRIGLALIYVLESKKRNDLWRSSDIIAINFSLSR